jgi:release factor glutamine methyltransferase
MIVLEVLQSTTDYFKRHGIESPRLNAEHLLAHVLGQKRIDLYLEFERVLTEAELTPLRELVKRRGQGEPLQHLLGTVEFCGNTFVCDGRALVPRPETEQLVELLISDVRCQTSDFRVMDVGTGSGVIALSLAAKFPDAQVHGLDVSEEALQLAAENAARLGLTERVRFLQGNLFENLSERFDLIVANLPYVAMNDQSSLSREVLHDPEVALYGGERGDEFIRALIEQAPPHLCRNGLLALEIGAGQSDALLELLAQKNYHDIESKTDYSGVPRFLFARYG